MEPPPTFRERFTGGKVPYFQLMHPPASSLEALERARRGEPVGEGVLMYPTEDGPFHVSFGILSEPFWLDDAAACLGFPNELGRWDLLRCRWEARGWQLEYAEHEFVWSLRVRGPDLGERSLETVRRVAEAVFGETKEGPAHGIVFLPTNDDGEVLFGVHDRSAREGKLQNWRDDITWYHDGAAVGFISFEANVPYGIIEVDEQRMRSWLQPYFDQVFDPIEQWMMFPPAIEREALDALDAGQDTPGVEGVVGSDQRVRNFELLIPALRVPKSTPCLVPRSSPRQWTTVRCRYQAGGWRIEQAMAASRALWVRGVTEPSGERQRAERVAAEVFGRPVALEVRGRYQGKTFGRAVPAESKAVRRTLEWWRNNIMSGTHDAVPERRALRTLRFWVEDDRVGFVHR